jgi:hypothetical protein
MIDTSFISLLASEPHLMPHFSSSSRVIRYMTPPCRLESSTADRSHCGSNASAFPLVYVRLLTALLGPRVPQYHLLSIPFSLSSFLLQTSRCVTFLFTHYISEARLIGSKQVAYVLLADSVYHMLYRICNISRKGTTTLWNDGDQLRPI